MSTAEIGCMAAESAFAEVIMSGANTECLRAPHLPGARKAADHLIGNEQDVVLAQDRLDLLEITLRRKNRPARAHDRLGEKCRDGVGSFRLQ